MSKMRHWKQRFDVNAELVFRKNMKLGIKGQEVVKRGDVVSQETKLALGRNRLRRWWDAGFLEWAEVQPVEESKPAPKSKSVDKRKKTQSKKTQPKKGTGE